MYMFIHCIDMKCTSCFSDVARVIVEHEGWAECLKVCTRQNGVESTPFRRMIRKMPGTQRP